MIYSVLLKDPSFLIKQWSISLERRQYFRDQVQKQKEFLTRDVPTLIDGSRPERDIDQELLKFISDLEKKDLEYLELKNVLEKILEQNLLQFSQEFKISETHQMLFKLKCN